MVDMFQINLNRQEGYAQREARKRKIRDRITVTLITILLLGMGYFTWTNDEELRNIERTKEKQLKSIIAQIDSLQRAGQNVNKEDVLSLARLDKERVFWTKKFRAIAERLPKEMTITSLELKRNTFDIGAITPIEENEREFDMVMLYMDRLRKTPEFFEDIDQMKFTESQRFKAGQQEILDFIVTCDIQKSVIYARRGSVRGR
ncbi:hypothetical protein GF324_02850 [bacterium]|nr:hypothetical protein [bacterium]